MTQPSVIPSYAAPPMPSHFGHLSHHHSYGMKGANPMMMMHHPMPVPMGYPGTIPHNQFMMYQMMAARMAAAAGGQALMYPATGLPFQQPVPPILQPQLPPPLRSNSPQQPSLDKQAASIKSETSTKDGKKSSHKRRSPSKDKRDRHEKLSQSQSTRRSRSRDRGDDRSSSHRSGARRGDEKGHQSSHHHHHSSKKR